MRTYVVLRRSGWRSPAELEEAAARSRRTGDQMADEVRWIRSYVIDEEAGDLGTVCVYQAVDAEAIRRHASRAFLPADEILPVEETVVVRPDPERAS